LNDLLTLDRFGRGTVQLPAFADWGTGWQFSGGPDDRNEAARAGLFPITLEPNHSGPVPEAQIRAVKWLLSEQAIVAEWVLAGVTDFLRLFGEELDADPVSIRKAVLLSGVRVYDPQVDRRYERDGVAIVGLAFDSEWNGHTDDHGIEAVVCPSGILHVGDQCTF